MPSRKGKAFAMRRKSVELAELAIAGGADTIQFRQKDGATRR
jgi:thiamine monophosphate synthase